MTKLSPAAQAVLDAYWKSPWDPSLQHEDRYAIAAALRAAADQWKTEIQGKPTSEFISGIRNCIGALNEIANELKSHD